MSVLAELIAVIFMQLATTFQEVTPVLATLDTQAMDLLALVRKSIYPLVRVHLLIIHYLSMYTHQTLMSASAIMEVANTTVMTQMEVTHVPAMMVTSLTVMDTHVKVGKSH